MDSDQLWTAAGYGLVAAVALLGLGILVFLLLCVGRTLAWAAWVRRIYRRREYLVPVVGRVAAQLSVRLTGRRRWARRQQNRIWVTYEFEGREYESNFVLFGRRCEGGEVHLMVDPERPSDCIRARSFLWRRFARKSQRAT